MFILLVLMSFTQPNNDLFWKNETTWHEFLSDHKCVPVEVPSETYGGPVVDLQAGYCPEMDCESKDADCYDCNDEVIYCRWYVIAPEVEKNECQSI